MKQITKVRKTVCAMANQLRKAGYSLKDAFKKAWQRVKLSMTIRAAGTTFENRQERLSFLRQFSPEDLSVTLEREPDNRYDQNAICIVVHIRSIRRRTVIGVHPQRTGAGTGKGDPHGHTGKSVSDADHRRVQL